MVKVNQLKYLSVFDSGSSENIVTLKLIDSLQEKVEIKPNKEFKIKLLNGSEIIPIGRTRLLIENEGRKVYAEFWVVKYGIREIIMGNKLITLLKKEKKEFPVECKIRTPPGK